MRSCTRIRPLYAKAHMYSVCSLHTNLCTKLDLPTPESWDKQIQEAATAFQLTISIYGIVNVMTVSVTIAIMFTHSRLNETGLRHILSNTLFCWFSVTVNCVCEVVCVYIQAPMRKCNITLTLLQYFCCRAWILYMYRNISYESNG